MLLKFKPLVFKTEAQLRRSEKRSGFLGFAIRCLGRFIRLDQLKDWINEGRKVSIYQEKSTNQLIFCELADDPWDGVIPKVVKSNHPRFVVGTRFDYGFMSVALKEGYTIHYNA